MSRPGYVDRRGSATDRARRRAWLLAEFDPDLGDGRARCRLRLDGRCLEVVDAVTLSVDRIEPGGSYCRANIQPACGPCQDLQGYLLGAATVLGPLLEQFRAARDAWERLFEEETSRTYVPGIIKRERRLERRGGRREVTDFLEAHPPPLLRDFLEAGLLTEPAPFSVTFQVTDNPGYPATTGMSRLSGVHAGTYDRPMTTTTDLYPGHHPACQLRIGGPRCTCAHQGSATGTRPYNHRHEFVPLGAGLEGCTWRRCGATRAVDVCERRWCRGHLRHSLVRHWLGWIRS